MLINKKLNSNKNEVVVRIFKYYSMYPYFHVCTCHTTTNTLLSDFSHLTISLSTRPYFGVSSGIISLYDSPFPFFHRCHFRHNSPLPPSSNVCDLPFSLPLFFLFPLSHVFRAKNVCSFFSIGRCRMSLPNLFFVRSQSVFFVFAIFSLKRLIVSFTCIIYFFVFSIRLKNNFFFKKCIIFYLEEIRLSS